MNYLLAQIETIIKGVDHASQQSLQWVIMAIVVAFAAFAWFVISYLVKREDSRMMKEERRAEQRDAQIAASVAAQIENTNMLREVREALDTFREVLDNHFRTK